MRICFWGCVRQICSSVSTYHQQESKERKYLNLVLLILFFLNSVVPSQPSEFKGEAKSETSILLSWVAPPQGGPDNQIIGYELVYRRVDDTEEVSINKFINGWVADRRIKDRYSNRSMGGQTEDQLISILKVNSVHVFSFF